MNRLLSTKLGFTPPDAELLNRDSLDQNIYRTAVHAARKKFTPEFMNRIDKIVVFRTLTRDHMQKILDLELANIRDRILVTQPDTPCILRRTDRAKDFLLDEGTDARYGARHLKRAIERYLVFPLANLISTGQIGVGDIVQVDRATGQRELTFTRERAAVVIPRTSDKVLYKISHRSDPIRTVLGRLECLSRPTI